VSLPGEGNELLKVYHKDVHHEKNHIRFNNVDELTRHLLASTGVTYTSTCISKPEDHQELLCWHVEDALHSLQKLITNTNISACDLTPHTVYDQAGNRVYASLQHGLDFELVNKDLSPGELCIPYSLFSDGSVIAMGKTSFHSVVIKAPALDMSQYDQPWAHILASLNPQLQERPEHGLVDGSYMFRLRKREILHQCLDIVLKPLKAIQYTGFFCTPAGYLSVRRCYPWLAFASVDLLEAWTLANLKNGKDLYSKITPAEVPLRYRDDCGALVIRDSAAINVCADEGASVLACGGTKARCIEICDPEDTWPLKSALRDLRWVDSLQCISVADVLHQDYAGVGLELLQVLLYDMKVTFGRRHKKKVATVNTRLRELGNMSGVKLPSNVSKV